VGAVGDLLHFHVSQFACAMRSMLARRNGTIVMALFGTSDHAARFIFEETRSPDDYRAIDACKLFTKPLNGLKTTFPKWSETNPF
jgi:hypothetical protein